VGFYVDIPFEAILFRLFLPVWLEGLGVWRVGEPSKAVVLSPVSASWVRRDILSSVLKAAETHVISSNGQIVDFGGGTHTFFVEDPNGMNIEVFERTESAVTRK
jgi:hypothetical protein